MRAERGRGGTGKRRGLKPLCPQGLAGSNPAAPTTSPEVGALTRTRVDWGGGAERRRRLESELERIVAELPRLGVEKAILFGSLASGRVGRTSDLDLILVVRTDEPFTRRLERLYGALNPAVAMDLFVYTPDEFRGMAESNSFVRAALARGRVVYAV